MGGGAWSQAAYDDAEELRASSATPVFAYHTQVATGKVAAAAHNDMDVKGKTREARDSKEHPNSVPIIVAFDVTGSMGAIPKTYRERLAKLMSIILEKNYLTDPQIAFAAIGDALRDRVPFQMGQFESDVRIAADLDKLYLEGGGAGNQHESYALAAYMAMKHVVTDAWEKRKRKGYLFLTGDEMSWPVTQKDATEIFGDSIEKDASAADLFKAAQERWETFFIFPTQADHGSDQEVISFWRKLFGERLIMLDDANNVAELIATTIGLHEQAIDLDDAAEHIGNASVAASVSRALAPLSVNSLTRGSASGSLPALSGAGRNKKL